MKLKLGIPKGSLEHATIDLFRRGTHPKQLGDLVLEKIRPHLNSAG